jgi:hypothetical protein
VPSPGRIAHHSCHNQSHRRQHEQAAINEHGHFQPELSKLPPEEEGAWCAPPEEELGGAGCGAGCGGGLSAGGEGGAAVCELDSLDCGAGVEGDSAGALTAGATACGVDLAAFRGVGGGGGSSTDSSGCTPLSPAGIAALMLTTGRLGVVSARAALLG